MQKKQKPFAYRNGHEATDADGKKKKGVQPPLFTITRKVKGKVFKFSLDTPRNQV